MRSLLCGLLAAAAVACRDGAPPTQPIDALADAQVGYDISVIDAAQTLGGSLSVPNSIDNRGTIAGFSNTNGDTTRQAVLWRDGAMIPLGTLGGPNSNVQWPGQNNTGMVVGIAETAELDPNGEDWSCTPFFATGEATGHVCRGFVWENGVMTALPTFGGTHGFATGVNSRGQVVGWAETDVEDDTCNEPQVLQFRAALWEPRTGTMRELSPLPGDSTSAATAINERGQVVGISGECDVAVGQRSARQSVLWESNGAVVEIGNLGGDFWHTPMAINDSGIVVGFSNPAAVPGTTFQPLPFVWSRQRGIAPLELLPGDVWGQAFGVNARGQVVGRSCGATCTAVTWKDGEVYDLNPPASENYPHHLAAARDIDDAGVITGNLVKDRVGPHLPFIATPSRVRP